MTTLLPLSHFIGTNERLLARFRGFLGSIHPNTLWGMRNFTLTLYAKRRTDGTFEYSLNVWENRAAGVLAKATNFESEAVMRQQLDAVMPVSGDAKSIDTTTDRPADYWFPFTMPMSDAQAANLGWQAEGPLERNLIH